MRDPSPHQRLVTFVCSTLRNFHPTLDDASNGNYRLHVPRDPDNKNLIDDLQ